LDEIGGPLFLSQLSSKISTSSHLREHYFYGYQAYVKRTLIQSAEQIINNSFDDSTDMQDVLDLANMEVDKVNDIVQGRRVSSHISQVVKLSKDAAKNREEAAKNKRVVGIRTPLPDLDRYTQGWQTGLYVLAARPSMGKTAIALAMAKSGALDKAPVCIYSLEMTSTRLSDRLIMGEADINEYNFRSGNFRQADWLEFDKACSRLSRLPIYIDDNPIVNYRYIKSHARTMKKKGLCNMIIIDYLQLVDMDDSRNANRERQVANTTRHLKILSKELDIPVILLSQLNRVIEGKDKRPDLSNLRESGAIEQDADTVIFIHRPIYYGIENDHNGNSWKGVGELLIRKNRDGPVGDIRFRHNESITKIYPWEDERNFTVQPISNRDRQLPKEKDDELPTLNQDLPF
jgi:replicative DNA helicase